MTKRKTMRAIALALALQTVACSSGEDRQPQTRETQQRPHPPRG